MKLSWSSNRKTEDLHAHSLFTFFLSLSWLWVFHSSSQASRISPPWTPNHQRLSHFWICSHYEYLSDSFDCLLVSVLIGALLIKSSAHFFFFSSGLKALASTIILFPAHDIFVFSCRFSWSSRVKLCWQLCGCITELYMSTACDVITYACSWLACRLACVWCRRDVNLVSSLLSLVG